MTYLVAYDISDNGRREQAVKILLDYGERVQESVFWMDIDEELAERMKKRLRAIVEKDVVWIVPLCRNCTRGVLTLGTARVPELPEYYVL